MDIIRYKNLVHRKRMAAKNRTDPQPEDGLTNKKYGEIIRIGRLKGKISIQLTIVSHSGKMSLISVQFLENSKIVWAQARTSKGPGGPVQPMETIHGRLTLLKTWS